MGKPGPTKQVTMLIRQAPLNTVRVSEALRVAVGYTLAPQRVTALLVDDAVYAASQAFQPEGVGQPGVAKHLEAITTLGHRVVVDGPSYEARGVFALRPEIEVLDREAVGRLLASSDTVVPF